MIVSSFKEKYHFFMASSANRNALRIETAVFGLVVLVILFLWGRLPPQLPLYYSLPWGHEQIGTPIELLGIVLASEVLFLVNSFIAMLLFKNHPFFSRILFFGGVSIVGLMIITAAKIVLLIT